MCKLKKKVFGQLRAYYHELRKLNFLKINFAPYVLYCKFVHYTICASFTENK